MRKKLFLNVSLLGLCLLALATVSCEKQGPAEEAGEKLDEAAEEVADEVDDATTE